jgi:ABC-type bacteriocin/lantibiotic exporter with double-glycine peptidase domain
VVEFRRHGSGALANIICVQSGRLVDGVVRPLLVCTTELCLLAGISILVFVISPLLIVAILIVCGLTMAAYYLALRTRALRWGERRMAAASTLQELVNSTAAGISEVKVFGKEDYLTGRVHDAAIIETDMFQRLEMHQHGPRFIVESAFMLTLAGVFTASVLLGSPVTVLLAQFSVVAAASLRILPSINRLVGSYSSLSFSIGPALTLLETVISLEDDAAASGGQPGTVVPETIRSIEVRNVSFAYFEAARPVLHDVNLTIGGGRRVGIVGASGSGKSTLLDIIAALHTPSAGDVRADAVSVFSAPRAWQARLGYVLQVPFIIPGTIRENVAFAAAAEADEDEIWHALETVGLAVFVRALPLRLDTPVGERGAGLSGGQKQLLCLARALYRHPTLLLLDEPTASLDPESERVVLDALEHLPRATTVIMVSHKHDNFSRFDDVYVCEGGNVTPARTGTRAMEVL